MAPGADQVLDIGLHDQLQDSLSDAGQEVAQIVLCRKLGQVHAGRGHPGLRIVRVEASKLHLDHTPDGRL